MGSGAPRELGSGPTERKLSAEFAAKLTAAMDKFDTMDEEFKRSRDDERHAQAVKTWARMSGEMEAYLREVGEVLNLSHQLSLDIGSDGGGADTRPWIEEQNGKFPRLYFRLVDGQVHAAFDDQEVGHGPLEAMGYDWVERAVVAWLILSVKAKMSR